MWILTENRLGIIFVVIIAVVILNNWKKISPYYEEGKCSREGIVVNGINQHQEDRDADVEKDDGRDCDEKAATIP
jgi:hypothetical protein